MAENQDTQKTAQVIDFTAVLHSQVRVAPKRIPKKKDRSKGAKIKAQRKSKKAVKALDKDPTQTWDGTLAKALAGLTHHQGAEFVMNRYNDNRYPEAKALRAVLKGIVSDLGGSLDTRQGILLNMIRSKIVVIMQINKYLETVETMIDNEKGSAKPVIDRTFPVYSKEISRLLKELYEGAKKKPKGKTYEELVEEMANEQSG